jgi:hypothetical protein
MPLRSGKRYLISHKCHACNSGYYSHQNFNYKCSGCWEYCEKNGIMTSKEFGDKCRQWATDNIIDENGRKFILKNKHMTDKHLFNFLTEILEHTGKYISAKTGLKLYNARPTNSRGHIIGSFVADWWEIKSIRVSEDKKWPGYMDCYYGFWSNPIESWSGINSASIPPKKPRGPKNLFINHAVIWATRNIA